jgi:hypothetical protein
MCHVCCAGVQARSAELLQLHTELRRTMFGTSSLARMTRCAGGAHTVAMAAALAE